MRWRLHESTSRWRHWFLRAIDTRWITKTERSERVIFRNIVTHVAFHARRYISVKLITQITLRYITHRITLHCITLIVNWIHSLYLFHQFMRIWISSYIFYFNRIYCSASVYFIASLIIVNFTPPSHFSFSHLGVKIEEFFAIIT